MKWNNKRIRKIWKKQVEICENIINSADRQRGLLIVSKLQSKS